MGGWWWRGRKGDQGSLRYASLPSCKFPLHTNDFEGEGEKSNGKGQPDREDDTSKTTDGL